MKSVVPLLFLLLLNGCHDAPPAPDCRFDGEPSPLHSNAGCIIVRDGRLLVLKHRFGGKLGIPGGAALEGEPAHCTAHRETWEETGLDVTVGEQLGRLRYGYTLYQCHPDKPLDTSVELELPWHALTEITDALWLRPKDIPREEWRYEDQVDGFLELVEKAQPPAE